MEWLDFDLYFPLYLVFLQCQLCRLPICQSRVVQAAKWPNSCQPNLIYNLLSQFVYNTWCPFSCFCPPFGYLVHLLNCTWFECSLRIDKPHPSQYPYTVTISIIHTTSRNSNLLVNYTIPSLPFQGCGSGIAYTHRGARNTRPSSHWASCSEPFSSVGYCSSHGT